MISRILKIELFFLFLLTVISFAAFYYGDVLPDNSFVISSETTHVNAISYYLTTFIVFVEYYSGPWVFFPFITYALFYSFVYSRRNYCWDTFNFLWAMILALGVVNFAFPQIIGSGLQQVIHRFVSPVMVGLSIPLFAGFFLWGSFRSSFGKNLWAVVKTSRYLPKMVIWVGHILRLMPAFFRNLVVKIKNFFGVCLKIRLPSALKGDKTKNVEIIENNPVNLVSEEESHVVKEIDEIEAIEDNLEVLEEAKVEKKVVKEKPRLERPKKVSVADERNYFSLVNCIADKKRTSAQGRPNDDYFGQITEQIEATLKDFKIDGAIIGVLKGPVVDTFLLELGKGVKVSKVTNIYQDICVALYGAPIRIVYPMKGRTTVGIEVPRNPREIIYLDEVLNSADFKKANYALPIAMGKDAYGEVFVVDLATMPHMLVAGATGSGKSVFINSLLVSLLVKLSPRKMKLILIDPKQLELALYANLPHLCMPVIVDAKRASLALKWVVQEMERRYAILKEFAVRNLEGFNSKLQRATPEMMAAIHQFYEDASEEYELPYIVVIIDEFADLILTKAGREIENDICRLAGKARAAGIHLVISTQRPSVDVITGLIKSNFPTRVSFRVTTNVDSRTILSAIGAEKLLGKGDMLYKRGVETVRVHSSFVDEGEIEVLVERLASMDKQFDPSVLDFLDRGEQGVDDPYAFGSHINVKDSVSDDDPRFDEAVKIVMEYRSASASMLQRRLKIGYNRAANLIELMEQKGIVGPAQGAKPRKVLTSAD